MNWEAVGAVGEVLGALGVIATLGYLAVQIRGNARSTSIATFQNSMRSAQDLATLVAQEGELSGILVRGAQNRGGLVAF